MVIVISVVCRDVVSGFMKGFFMKVLVSRLVSLLVAVVAPLVLREVIHALEEMLKVDLDHDGVVGFPPKVVKEEVSKDE